MLTETDPATADRAELWRWAAGIAVCLLLVALFVPLPGRFRALWIGCLQDLAHVPLFATLAWLLELLTRRSAAAAAAVALGLAILVEPLQALVGRSTSLDDFLRGACGIGMFLAWRLADGVTPRWRRTAVRIASVVVGALPIVSAWPTLWDAAEAWREFPVLADFSSPWESRRWITQWCSLTCETVDGAGFGLVQCRPGVDKMPTMVLLPVLTDWSQHRFLHIEFTIEGDPLPMIISVRDGRRVEPPRRRFDSYAVYDAGRQAVAIDLVELSRGAGDVAPIDVQHVQSFHFVFDSAGKSRVVRLHRLWLE